MTHGGIAIPMCAKTCEHENPMKREQFRRAQGRDLQPGGKDVVGAVHSAKRPNQMAAVIARVTAISPRSVSMLNDSVELGPSQSRPPAAIKAPTPQGQYHQLSQVAPWLHPSYSR